MGLVPTEHLASPTTSSQVIKRHRHLPFYSLVKFNTAKGSKGIAHQSGKRSGNLLENSGSGVFVWTYVDMLVGHTRKSSKIQSVNHKVWQIHRPRVTTRTVFLQTKVMMLCIHK